MVRISVPTALGHSEVSSLLANLAANAPGSTEAAVKIVSSFTPAALSKSNNVVVTHGEGCWVHTACGRKLLDFASGIGVNSTGHSHPRVVAAVQRQAARVVHAQQNIFAAHDQMVEFLPLLHSVLPFKRSLDNVLLANSGAEAVENAVKVARAATGRPHVIAFDGAFHGRTMGTMALTSSKNVYKKGFGPLMPGVVTAPYPYCLHCKTQEAKGYSGYPLHPGFAPFGDESIQRVCCGGPLESLEWMLKMQVAPEDVAAVIIEPIMGEGGFLTPPPGFLPDLRRLCTRHGILLIVDEVQSGVGRSGKWWGQQHWLTEGPAAVVNTNTNTNANAAASSSPAAAASASPSSSSKDVAINEELAPDIVTFAKGIASGYPMSGLAFKGGLVDAKKLPPGSVGGTYGGNAVCTAAAVATIRAIEEEGMIANAAARGEQLTRGLLDLAARLPVITDIRGRGLMIGVEFGGLGGERNVVAPKGFANKVAAACGRRDMLLLTAGARESVRFLPPLVVSQQEMDLALRIFEDSVKEVLKEY